jgi:hypothetical protein
MHTDIARELNRHIGFAAVACTAASARTSPEPSCTAVDVAPAHPRLLDHRRRREHEFAGVRQAKYLPVSFPAGGR